VRLHMLSTVPVLETALSLSSIHHLALCCRAVKQGQPESPQTYLVKQDSQSASPGEDG